MAPPALSSGFARLAAAVSALRRQVCCLPVLRLPRVGVCSVWVAVSTQAIAARQRRRYRRPNAAQNCVHLAPFLVCLYTGTSISAIYPCRGHRQAPQTSLEALKRGRARAKRQPLRSAVATTKAQRSSDYSARPRSRSARRRRPTAAPRARSEAALHTSSSTESRDPGCPVAWRGAAPAGPRRCFWRGLQ